MVERGFNVGNGSKDSKGVAKEHKKWKVSCLFGEVLQNRLT